VFYRPIFYTDFYTRGGEWAGGAGIFGFSTRRSRRMVRESWRVDGTTPGARVRWQRSTTAGRPAQSSSR
jgi:hypothetical protein